MGNAAASSGNGLNRMRPGGMSIPGAGIQPGIARTAVQPQHQAIGDPSMSAPVPASSPTQNYIQPLGMPRQVSQDPDMGLDIPNSGMAPAQAIQPNPVARTGGNMMKAKRRGPMAGMPY